MGRGGRKIEKQKRAKRKCEGKKQWIKKKEKNRTSEGKREWFAQTSKIVKTYENRKKIRLLQVYSG